jgi:hypothetical protein
MPREVFVAGQILTAAEMNIVSDQTVMTFAGTAARGSAIPTPSEGMAAYLNDSNSVQIYDGSAWKRVLNTTGSILQVVSTVMSNSFTTTSTVLTDVTGLTVSITPSSATSKVLVICEVMVGAGAGGSVRLNLTRDSTDLAVPTFATNNATMFQRIVDNNDTQKQSFCFLDSPASTSALTYKIRAIAFSGQTVAVNRRGNDLADGGSSSITVMEVAG